MILEELLSGVRAVSVSGKRDAEVSALTFDSRNVAPRSAFFTLPGSKTDGNRYVRQAVERGASAILSELKLPPAPMSLVAPGSAETPVTWVQVEDIFSAMGRAAANFYRDPSADLSVVGVTGTNGKTTTTYFLESVFARCGGPAGVIGTISHRLGGKTLEKAVNTTPFSLDVMRLLARMRDAGARKVAMEVSSHALATKRVDEVRFDAAVLTNLGRDHLDFHKTEEDYFEAKARLFELLERADAPKSPRAAVVNGMDPAGAKIRRRVQNVPVADFGLGDGYDYCAQGLVSSRGGTTFRILSRGEEYAVTIRLPGEHNVLNALAAFACACELGLDSQKIIEGLASLEGIPGRLESVSAGQDFSIFVDFAHTESALVSVLESLKRLPHRRIITVFGCGGDRDQSKRAPMGAAACAASDAVVATSDNPRGEDPMDILRSVEEGMRSGGRGNYRVVAERREAIFEAIRLAQKDDIVLIAGKGHEKTQTLQDREIDFDDVRAAREALKDCGRI